MKKIFCVMAVLIFSFSFSQTNVKVISDKDKLNETYSGGQEKFDNDFALNLQHTGDDYQVTGDFVLNFSVNEGGSVSEVKLLPELFDKSFEREVKRDLSRIKKHFAVNQKEKFSVALNFSRTIREANDRLNFAPNQR